MKILELFSGTESVSTVFKEYEHQTFTIDIDRQFNPTLCIDILNFEMNMIPWKPDFIWASPPCVSWSTMSGGKHRTKDNMQPKSKIGILGEKYLLKTLEIIDCFQPTYFCIENPRGLMRYHPSLKDIRRDTINYCRYGSRLFKPTDLFHNIECFKGKVCKYERSGMKVDCNHYRVPGSHKNRKRAGCQRVTQKERYIIPRLLVIDILNCLNKLRS